MFVSIAIMLHEWLSSCLPATWTCSKAELDSWQHELNSWQRTGLQYLLPATWTALKSKGADLASIARILCEQPARLLGLTSVGRILIGNEADLVVSAAF